MTVLFVKAFVRGYLRDGKWVSGYFRRGNSRRPEPPKKPRYPKLEGIVSKLLGGSQMSLFGGMSSGFAAVPPSPPEKAKAYHPHPDNFGRRVPIWEPTIPTDLASWSDPNAIATVCPDGELPDTLNGIALEPWTDHPRTLEGWDYVDGQNDQLEEPDMEVPSGYKAASGVVVQEPDGRVWVMHPTNRFSGYKRAFPKGQTEDELSFQAGAIKECFEETGLKVEIDSMLCDIKRGATKTRYYRAHRVGGSPAAMGWESQAVSLVPADEVADFVNSHYDKKVAAIAGFGKPHKVEVTDEWELAGPQRGSNPGGMFKDKAGQKWYCKFPESYAHARNELLAAKLYEALGVRVPELKMIEDYGDIGLASKVVEGVKQDAKAIQTPGKVPGVYEGFVADAWLANWDSVGLGYDNMLVTPEGDAIRIDLGGSLLYRAQGLPKGDAFGDKVGEIDSLRDPKNHYPASVFGEIPQEAIVAGVKRLAALPDHEIRGLVETYGPGGRSGRARLADKLVARKADLVSRFLSRPSSLAHDMLKQEAEAWRQLFAHENLSGNPTRFKDWLLENGEECGPAIPLPKGMRMKPIKQCYQNSYQALIPGDVDEDEWVYTEGIVVRPDLPIALDHAWLTNRKGEVLDLTLRDNADASYFGIPFTYDELLRLTLRSGYYGLFNSGVGYNEDIVGKPVGPGVRAWPKKMKT